MKALQKISGLVLSLTFLFFATSCEDNGIIFVDTTPPAAPKNVQTIVGDNQVDIIWDRNIEHDLAGYNVYFAWDYDGKYELIGSTENDYFIDYDARNGEKYFYAVVAYDYNGNESDLSTAYVYGAPRPEGYNRVILDFVRFPDLSGFLFGEYAVVNFQQADFFYENYDGTFYINVWPEDEIQDMGPTNSLIDIEFAPTSGWVPLYDINDDYKYVEAIVGHTYVIHTFDGYYAKIRVKSLTGERMTFDWAFQTIQGETQLKQGITVDRNKEHPSNPVIKSR